MRKRVFMFASLSLILTLVAGAALGASTKVLLSPKSREGPSDAIVNKGGEPHFPNTLGADYLISYDTGTEPTAVGGLYEGDTMLVWFQSPAACTLLEIHCGFWNAGDYDIYAGDAPDGIDWLNDYEEYHGGSTPGPRPIETIFDDDQGRTNPGYGWQVLDVVSRPDVGTDVFVGGYVLRSADTPLPIIDPGISRPPEGYHTLMERNVGGGPRGWYSSWHHVYIRALVSLYENLAPTVVSYTRLPDTYSVTGRSVTCHLTDIGVPPESTGVAVASLLYSVNGGAEDTIPMTLVSGTIESGDWAGYLPPASAGDTVSYSISAVDFNGAEETVSSSYVIRAGQASAELLLVDDDPFSYGVYYDPVAAVVPDTIYDVWSTYAYGLPDQSVFNFGYKAILWYTFDGTGSQGFVADTLLIAQFLDDGGALFVSSQDLPAGGFHYSWGAYTTEEGEWLHDHLHLMGGFDDWAGDTISVYYGVPGDPVSGSFVDWPITNYPYRYLTPYYYNFAGYCIIDPNDLNASGIFYDVGDPISGYKYEVAGAQKIVFLYWPFDYLVNPDGTADTTNMDILVANTMIWFGVDPVGITEKVKDRLRSRSKRYLLWQNWPNPAKGPTTISFNVPEPTRATLRVYDIAGRVVNTLVDDHVSAGRHSLTWNGTDKFGQEVPSGVYIYRLSAGKHNMARKMVLVR